MIKMKCSIYVFSLLLYVSISGATDKFYSDGGSGSGWGWFSLVILVPVGIYILYLTFHSPIDKVIKNTDSWKKFEKESKEEELWQKRIKEEEYRLQQIESQKKSREIMLRKRTYITDGAKERLIREVQRNLADGSFSYPKGAKPYNNEFPYDAIFDDGTKIYYDGREDSQGYNICSKWYYEETHEPLYKDEDE